MSLPKTVEHQYSNNGGYLWIPNWCAPSQWTNGRGGRRRYYCKTWKPQSVWEKAAPSFHEWFWKTGSQQFKDSLTMSARQSLGIEGCFYTSGLELKHKLQKMRLWECEIPNEVADVSAELQTGSEEFWGIEEARAIRGLDKDDHFYVDHTKWNCWSPERQRQHFNRFRKFVPKSHDS